MVPPVSSRFQLENNKYSFYGNFNDWCFWDQKTFLMPHTYVSFEKLGEIVLMFLVHVLSWSDWRWNADLPWTSQKDILFYYFWNFQNSWIKIKKTFIEFVTINDRLLFSYIIAWWFSLCNTKWQKTIWSLQPKSGEAFEILATNQPKIPDLRSQIPDLPPRSWCCKSCRYWRRFHEVSL